MKKLVLISVLTIYSLNYYVNGQEQKNDFYQDPNGYFSLFKPDGWKTSEYNETSRGKIKFIHPENEKVKVIVIGEPNSYNSFNDLVTASKNSDKRMKDKYQAYDVTITSETFTVDNVQYTKSIATLKKMDIKQLLVDFIIDDIHFSISYAAPISTFDTYTPKIYESIYSIIPSSRQFTDQEIKNALIDSKFKQAQFNIQMGMNDYAIKYIDEGLAIDPGNKKLTDLKNQINK